MYKKGDLFRIKANNEICIYLSMYSTYEYLVLYKNEEWVFFENELELIDPQSRGHF